MADTRPLPPFPRKRIFVDPRVQGALVSRAGLYWGYSMLAIALTLMCARIIFGPARVFYLHFDDMWYFYGNAFFASCAILPLVLLDVVRFSNRFVGPLLRLRRSMRALTRGQPVQPIYFREGDFWKEFADEFNALASHVEQLREQRSSAEVERDEVVSAP